MLPAILRPGEPGVKAQGECHVSRRFRPGNELVFQLAELGAVIVGDTQRAIAVFDAAGLDMKKTAAALGRHGRTAIRGAWTPPGTMSLVELLTKKKRKKRRGRNFFSNNPEAAPITLSERCRAQIKMAARGKFGGV